MEISMKLPVPRVFAAAALGFGLTFGMSALADEACDQRCFDVFAFCNPHVSRPGYCLSMYEACLARCNS